MKNFLVAVALVLMGAGVCRAASSDPATIPDLFCAGEVYYSNGSTQSFCIDSLGNIIPGRNQANNIGSPTARYRTIFAWELDVSSGLVNFTDTYVDLSSGSARGAVPTAGISIPTTTLRGGATTYLGAFLVQSTGAPRNIIIFSSANVNPTTTTLTMAATFYGFDSRGNWTSELIRWSTNTIQWSSAAVTNTNQLEYRGVGNVAWAVISSFTVQITSMTDQFGLTIEVPKIFIGFGQKIGLSNNITATTDIYKITQAGGQDTTSASLFPLNFINPTFDTIVFSPEPNGADEKRVWGRATASH